jgi:outer membrane protein assembly factor BamB
MRGRHCIMKSRRGCQTACIIAFMVFLTTSAWGAAGDQLWETEFTTPNYSDPHITALSVTPTAVIVCGYASMGVIANQPMQIGFARAFDLATGQFKWEQSLTLGSSTNSFTAISTSGGIVLLMGTSYGWLPDLPTNLSKAVVRACNADTGQILWETQKDLYNSMAIVGSSPPLSLMATVNNRTYLAVIAPSGVMPATTVKCVLYAFQTNNVAAAANLSLLLDK